MYYDYNLSKPLQLAGKYNVAKSGTLIPKYYNHNCVYVILKRSAIIMSRKAFYIFSRAVVLGSFYAVTSVFFS